jgi:hypothetical protein
MNSQFSDKLETNKFNLNCAIRKIVFPFIEFNEIHSHIKRIELSKIKDYNTLLKVEEFNNYKFYGLCIWTAIMALENMKSYKRYLDGNRILLGYGLRTYFATCLFYWTLLYKFSSLKNVGIEN